eukprot:scaffold229352_cov23-Tisochrysis_lutea.AAC.1
MGGGRGAACAGVNGFPALFLTVAREASHGVRGAVGREVGAVAFVREMGLTSGPVGQLIVRRGACGKTYLIPGRRPSAFTAAGRPTKVSVLSGEQYMPWSRMTVWVCVPVGSMTISPGSSDVVRRLRPEGATV